MKVVLIKTSGQKVTINVDSFDEARQIVCNFSNDAEAETLNLSNGQMLMIDLNGKTANYPENSEATKIALEFSQIDRAVNIVGDVILIDDTAAFDKLPYQL